MIYKNGTKPLAPSEPVIKYPEDTSGKPKMFIVSQPDYFWPFEHQFGLTYDPAKADVLLFTGGADVSPQMYGEGMGRHTYINAARDIREVALFENAVKAGKKFLGICRGAQFLTVMSGGKLIQDVGDHCNGPHRVHTSDGDTVVMSSTHHQMMFPEVLDKKDYVLLGWADHISRYYMNGDNNPIPHSGIEPEMVYYPKTKALCIQGHPEQMSKAANGVQYCQELVNKYLLQA